MLLSSVQTPHSELVGALYRDHRGWLLAWLRRNVACPQRAEDLSQDTFVRLLGRTELQAPREPRAFLAAIAKGLLFDYFRRAALEQVLTRMKADPARHHIYLGVEPENPAVSLYRSLGFRFDGRVYGREHIMVLDY